MREVIFWGGTGQAKVLAEALDPAQWRVGAIVDARAIPAPIDGVPMLHGERALRDYLATSIRAEGRHFAVAVGGAHGGDRLQLFALMQSMGLTPLTIVHPRAFVARNANIGPGAQVLAMAAICVHASLGPGVIVNTAATVDHDCRVGAGAHIGPGAHLAGEVDVGEGAFIGTGAVVLPRIRIGSHARVGAGAVVTRDVRDNATVVGNPARQLESS